MSRKPTCEMFALIITTLILPVTLPSAHAEVRLPGFLGDHMVLQRRQKLAIWGWAKPGETVTVSITGSKATTEADGSGKWREMREMISTSQAEYGARWLEWDNRGAFENAHWW